MLHQRKSPLKARFATEGATVRVALTWRGSPISAHSLDYEASTGDRLTAHAKGYVGYTVAERRKAND